MPFSLVCRPVEESHGEPQWQLPPFPSTHRSADHDDEPATRLQDARDLRLRLVVEDVLGWEGTHDGGEGRRPKGERAGVATHQVYPAALRPPTSAAQHGRRAVEPDNQRSATSQVGKQLTGSTAEIQDAVSLEPWQNTALPLAPLSGEE